MLCPILVGIAFVSGCAAEDGIEDETCDPPTVLRIDRVTLPTNNTETRALGFDLNGDRTVDNQAGQVASALHSSIADFDLSAAATSRLSNDLVWQLAISECSSHVAITLGPSSVANHVSLAGVHDDRGHIIAKATGDDIGALPMSTLFDPTAQYLEPGWIASRRTQLDLVQLDDGRWEGRIGVVLDPMQLADAVARPLAPYFEENGLFMEYLDVSPRDGHLSAEEMKNTTVVKSLLAPDIADLGTSFGVGFSGTLSTDATSAR